MKKSHERWDGKLCSLKDDAVVDHKSIIRDSVVVGGVGDKRNFVAPYLPSAGAPTSFRPLHLVSGGKFFNGHQVVLVRILVALNVINHSIYRVGMVVSYMGWVYFDFGHSTVCPALLGKMGVWQNRLS